MLRITPEEDMRHELVMAIRQRIVEGSRLPGPHAINVAVECVMRDLGLAPSGGVTAGTQMRLRGRAGQDGDWKRTAGGSLS